MFYSYNKIFLEPSTWSEECQTYFPLLHSSLDMHNADKNESSKQFTWCLKNVVRVKRLLPRNEMRIVTLLPPHTVPIFQNIIIMNICAFPRQSYKKLTLELQRSDIASLSPGAKLAFFINVYNALVIHGTVEQGRPGNMYSRYNSRIG